MSDGKYFTTASKGELFELQQQLNSGKKSEKAEAVKKVIAAMTVGKDVGSLFSDVINCMQTDNLELKKLVYLYLMNYAKTEPDKAILAVNTFVKDCIDGSPLIRALAVRTMGCIRVDKITEYLCEPLRKCLKDDDPYVRKTAAICVAKLHDIDPPLVQEQGFIEALQELLSDSNPMVVANAVAALSEIHEYSTLGEVFDLNPGTVSKLLTALNECTEWGQVFILDSLAMYNPQDDKERQSICERVTPRLQHVNAAVVLSAVKVLMKNLDQLGDAEVRESLYRKLAPPLVTLLSSEPEVQYVALRNINLIVQKRANILTHHMKVFFVKYNDPVYVKMEKLDIMIRLVSSENIQQVLAELREYASEVDVDFVRKSVRAIGRCAIKVEYEAQRCVDTLLELIKTKVNYVVQEAIIVIKDIFRKYPNKYENIIGTLCDNLDTLDEPGAKAAMIWIVGEYAERIDNADELLESFLENFIEEDTQVQLQLLTATVKLFLKRPTGTQELVQKVLGLATQNSDNPDLRDRGYIYWRLLLTDPAAAKAVVLCQKPLISEETDLLEPSLLDELICHISSLASVFHRPPSTFVDGRAPGRRILPKNIFEDVEEEDSGSAQPDLITGLSDMTVSSSSGGAFVSEKSLWLDASGAGKGLEIRGTFVRRDGRISMEMIFKNTTAEALGDFAIQFNKNSFGLLPLEALQVPTLAPQQSADASLAVNTGGPVSRMDPLNLLMVAVKDSIDVLYFNINIPFYVYFADDGLLDKSEYLQTWRSIDDNSELASAISGISAPATTVVDILKRNNVFLVAKRSVNEQELCYMSLRLLNGIVVLLELGFKPGDSSVKLAIRTPHAEVAPYVQTALESLLHGAASEA